MDAVPSSCCCVSVTAAESLMSSRVLSADLSKSLHFSHEVWLNLGRVKSRGWDDSKHSTYHMSSGSVSAASITCIPALLFRCVCRVYYLMWMSLLNANIQTGEVLGSECKSINLYLCTGRPKALELMKCYFICLWYLIDLSGCVFQWKPGACSLSSECDLLRRQHRTVYFMFR